MRSVTQWKLFAVGLALAGIYTVVEPQIKPKAVVLEMTDEAEPEVVATAQVPQPQPAPPAKEVAAVPVQTARIPLNARSFDESMKGMQLLSYVQLEDSSIKSQPVQFREASLPSVVVAPKQEPKKVAFAWTATLEERKGIARAFLERNCPNILTLEKMQSAASEKETNDLFMKAKNPGAIIATVKRQLSEHNVVVGQFCPETFYNQLFAKK